MVVGFKESRDMLPLNGDDDLWSTGIMAMHSDTQKNIKDNKKTKDIIKHVR